MIISASRRTDIPSYYSEWFFNRLTAGYALVRNPMNYHQISYVNLSPDVVDGIVLWTKNPIPMLDSLHRLDNYTYYFQFTLTPYGKDIEPNLPSKSHYLIPAFQNLSKRVGRNRVIWRYDPIFINQTYTIEYHKTYFYQLAKRLAPFTQKCTISFLDLYRNTLRNIKPFSIHPPSPEEQLELVTYFSEVSHRYGLQLDTCAERNDLHALGVSHAHCIDKHLLEEIGHYQLHTPVKNSQRPFCGCFPSIDIGGYNTCQNGCVYCYANYNQKIVSNQCTLHNPLSPLIFGEVCPADTIKRRFMYSLIDSQCSFFDF